MAFTNEQKMIAKALMEGAETIKDLERRTGFSREQLETDLNKMVELKVVHKRAEKYFLDKKIIDEVSKRKKIAEKDSFTIRLRAIIEFQAISKELLKKNMKKVKEALKKEKVFTIYSMEEAKVVFEDEMFSSFLELNLSVKDFPSAIRLLFYYGPSTIEVIKPSKVTLSQFEFQEGLVDLASIFQGYAKYFMSRINKEEIEKLRRKIYS